MSRAAPIAKALPTEYPLATLRCGEKFRALLPQEWNAYRSPQQLAWLSKWSQWFFAGSLLSWGEQLLVEQRVYPLWQWTGSFSLNHQGFPEQISVSHLSLFAQSDVAQQQALTQLITGFISPVCTTLAGVSGQPLALFWSNAAVRLHQSMRRAAQKKVSTQLLHDLFAATHLENGERNRLYQPFIMLDQADKPTIMQRRHCCMRFHLDNELCHSCPLDRCPTSKL